MSTLDLLHIISSILFGLAAFDKLKTGQAEHFYTRMVVSIWLMMTFIFHETMPVQWVRELSNYVLMTIPIIEVVSPRFIKYWKNK